jgi:predicted RNase H-like HicB family nuclease
MIPKYHINLFWSESDGAWVADVPDLQSCSAFGDTPAEALAEIEQAIEAWLAIAREDGMPIPEPRYRAPTRAFGRVLKTDLGLAVGAAHRNGAGRPLPRRPAPFRIASL